MTFGDPSFLVTVKTAVFPIIETGAPVLLAPDDGVVVVPPPPPPPHAASDIVHNTARVFLNNLENPFTLSPLYPVGSTYNISSTNINLGYLPLI